MVYNPFLRLGTILVMAAIGLFLGLAMPAVDMLYPVFALLILAIANFVAPKGPHTLFIALILIIVATYVLGSIFSGHSDGVQ
jgi:hypothetical protein